MVESEIIVCSVTFGYGIEMDAVQATVDVLLANTS